MFAHYDAVGPDDDVPGGLEPTPYELACQAYYQERELERLQFFGRWKDIATANDRYVDPARLRNCPEFESGETAQKPTRIAGNGCGQRP